MAASRSSIGAGTISGATATLATSALAGGTHTITASWAGNTDYNAVASAAITQTVNKATPTLGVASSGTPSTYCESVTFTATMSAGPTGNVTFLDGGAPIGTGMLSATTATFATHTLEAGAHAIAAGWAGNGNYNPITSSAITQTVSKVTPTITWATPVAITAGTALSGTQLNATANNFPGVFTYFPGLGTVLDAGTQTLSAIFTPTDPKGCDYPTATATVSLVVKADPSGQNTPVIAWATPAAISYGTALSTTQLNATASYNGTIVPGTFEYTPAAGEILDAGSQALLAAFFPTDSIHYATAGGSVLLKVAPSNSVNPATIYSYSITTTSGGSGYASNGNLQNYTDSVTGTWSFNYDSLNRLIAGMPAAGNPINNGGNLCWSYDSFGNRTAQSSQSKACPTLPSVPTATATYNANNQVTWTTVNAASSGFGYDAAGNVLGDNVNTYIYDGEGRVCAVKHEPAPGTYTMTAYVYDADGNRVAKGTLASWPSNNLCPDVTASGVFTPTNSYVLGPSNEQLTETDGSGNWIHSNVYAAGTLIATYDTAPTGQPALHFQLEDWLGSRRVQTDIAGNPEETFASLPFGDGLAATVVSGTPSTADDATEYHFTGKERDTESGNDYFGARYYSSNMGRFFSRI
jgi:RHS repeat-associated protein